MTPERPAAPAGDLASRYDLVIFDLDGVLYLTDQPVVGAVDAVRRLATTGVPLVYATNNASRTVEAVADLLASLGYPAGPDDVLTSARATAALLAQRYPAASPILVVGSAALAEDVKQAGLCPVTTAAEQPVAVVQGLGLDVGWRQLAEAHLAVRAGAAWIATNTDLTIPSSRGALPGNGALVTALAAALGRRPDTVVGKPEPGLFEQAVRLTGASRPLAVGDRLDTDIEGANGCGMDSLFVLTGVSRPIDLLTAPAHLRPSYVAEDLSGLFEPGVRLAAGERGTAGTGGVVESNGPRLALAGSGSTVAALRALCGPAWAVLDATGVATSEVYTEGAAAATALAELGVAVAAGRD